MNARNIEFERRKQRGKSTSQGRRGGKPESQEQQGQLRKTRKCEEVLVLTSLRIREDRVGPDEKGCG